MLMIFNLSSKKKNNKNIDANDIQSDQPKV